MTFAATQPGAQLERWDFLIALLGAFALVVVALAITGRRAKREDDWLLWVPNGLERVTGIPGWAAGMIGTAAFGLLVAGIGFYNDVAWHVGRGRDDELFTAPHTMIIVGLGLIALAAAIGILFATLQRVDTPLRVKGVRVPWSAVPLGLLGVCALGGFPLDELWHQTYGIDVTMWSPTHMLMICGAAFSLIAAWLALAEAGVPFRQNRWTKVVHFVAAWFVVAGLTAPLGEFRFGVPQFQQLFHPLLLLLAAAFAFVPTRIVLGRGWAIVLALATFLPESIGLMSSTASDGFVPTRTPGMFIASAVAVEIAAALFGTERRLRFALASGVGVATIGLAGEWWWNRNATQPWNGVLMRDALIIGLVVAIGAAVLGAAYAGAVNREPGRLPRLAILLAAVAVLIGILLPMPRRTSNVVARIDVAGSGDTVSLTVHVDPPDAAKNARWFQAIAWQGGGLRVVGLHEVAPGTYATDTPLPVGGKWKSILRLHTGAVMMSAPVFLPADPEIGAPEIPATSRTIAFAGEQQYLMREVKAGPNTVMVIAYAVVGLVVIAWAAAFVLACTRIPKGPPLRTAGTRSVGPEPDRAEPTRRPEPELVSR
jgi:hypothetical protein